MSDLDCLLDEIFVENELPQEANDCLCTLTAALAPLGLAALTVLDELGHPFGTWTDESVDEAQATADLKELLYREVGGSELYVEVRDDDSVLFLVETGRDRGEPGFLVGCLRSQSVVESVQQRLRGLLPWMRATASFLLTIYRQSHDLKSLNSRLSQMTRQHDAFRDENCRMVVKNMEESDARLREQKRYATQLELEVAARTRELIDSETRTRLILDTAPDGIITYDENGRIQSFNRSAEEVFGYNADEIIGRPISILAPDTGEWTCPCPPQEISEAVAHRRDSHEVTGRRRDGTTFSMHFTLSSTEIDGRALFTTIIRDITERKETEEFIRFQNERLEMASNAKSEFLANMSHEIRTPMTAILGFSDILRERLTDPEYLSILDPITRNGEFLLEIINDILDLAKVEAGKLEVERIPCSPVTVLHDVVSLMRVRADQKGLSLELGVDGPIPETICSDPTRLRQILTNLVSNAIKFTESGGVRILTRVASDDSGESRLAFDVVDTGIGLTAEQSDKLFVAFAQADTSTTRKYGGTGLGLSISQRLAEMLDGTVSVASRPGEGSTFTLSISIGNLEGVKMLDPADGIEQPEELQDSSKAELPSLEGVHVLLAEDGPDNQRLITYLLQNAGAEVTVADNGLIAVDLVLGAAAEGKFFDTILMDMQMPELDGYSATRRLRREGYTLPIIALTAHAMAGDREKCEAAGCDEYITKPVDRGKLIRYIAAAAATTK